MREKGNYSIDIGGLKNGIHEFEYHIDDSFFAKFENSLFKDSDIDVLVTIDKKQVLALVDFTFSGKISTLCDRCLEPLTLELEGYNELLVKLADTKDEENGSEDMDVIQLAGRDHYLDVSHYLYEYICLQVPYRNIHPDDENGNTSCNPEVLKEMEKHLTQEHVDDPRWEILKNINLN